MKQKLILLLALAILALAMLACGGHGCTYTSNGTIVCSNIAGDVYEVDAPR